MGGPAQKGIPGRRQRHAPLLENWSGARFRRKRACSRPWAPHGGAFSLVGSILVFGVGFLFASLLGLVILPLVHARAVRLTAKRLEAATPVSMAEIQADKDQLRAEFAMSTRRLEMSVDQLKAKTSGQLAEIG